MAQAVVEFTWDEAEYVALAGRYGSSRLMARVWVLVAVACFAFAVTLKTGGPWPYAVGAFYLAYAWFVGRTGPRKAWQKIPGIQRPQRLAFSSECIDIDIDGEGTSAPWDFFKYTFERNDCYLLCHSRRAFSIAVPKRAFSSSSDETAFRELAQTHTKTSLRSN